MAVETVTILKDDLTGEAGEDVQTVSFSYKGYDFEIELSEANRDELDKALEKFLEKARQPKAPRSAARTSGTGTTNPSTPIIRKWAQSEKGRALVESKGLTVPADRGRIDGEVRDLWEAEGRPKA